MHKELAFSMDAKLKILNEIQNESKEYFDYDDANPKRHEYIVFTPICIAGTFPRDIKTIWHFLKVYPAPKYDNFFPIKDGDISSLIVGKVSHKVEDSKFTVINYTLKDHWMHPGAVVRKVIKTEGIIGIATYGEGTGIMRDSNENQAKDLWTAVDKSILIAVASARR